MKRKGILFAVLSALILAAFCALSLRINRSYQNTAATEAQLAQELPSTDLSSLSFNGFVVGEKNTIVPYEGWEGDEFPKIIFNFEDDERSTFGEMYYMGGVVDSRLKKIEVYDLENGITASYKAKTIHNATRLHEYLGNSYIDVPASGGEPRLFIYIDHIHNLKLTLEVRGSSLETKTIFLEEFDADLYHTYVPESHQNVLFTGYSPILVTSRVISKLSYNYTIFRTRNLGFTDSELMDLPIYYWLVVLPVVALAVFRNRQMVRLNIVLAVINLLWPIATILWLALTIHV